MVRAQYLQPDAGHLRRLDPREGRWRSEQPTRAARACEASRWRGQCGAVVRAAVKLSAHLVLWTRPRSGSARSTSSTAIATASLPSAYVGFSPPCAALFRGFWKSSLKVFCTFYGSAFARAPRVVGQPVKTPGP